MTELYNCPICAKELKQENKIKCIDCSCKRDVHYYGARYKHGELTKVKIRFREPGGDKFYIKFHYDLDFTEVWTIKMPEDGSEVDEYDRGERIHIAGTFVPDYTDTDKLKQKIKTYLLFS